MKRFPSKILLFGEYTLMHDSHALAVPFPKFSGYLKMADENFEAEIWSNGELRKLLNYLEENFNSAPYQALASKFDIQTFKEEVENGLCFSSNIPEGYGLGSSGALTAAVYEKYVNGIPKSLENLKQELALIESFFHGKSSGIDALTSFLNKAILLKNNKIQEVELKKNIRIFLMDTGIVHNTQPLVKWYHESSGNPTYLMKIQQELIPTVNKSIENLINGETDFLLQVQQLSAIEFELFSPMIPDSIKPLWKKGLENGSFTLKLCGAGGGGYMLVFSKENELDSALGNSSLIEV